MSKRVLAIASAGGHWDQMMRLRAAFAGQQVTFVTTRAGLAERAGVETVVVPDCNRDERLRIVACAARLTVLILRVRPHVIVTTGALPGVIGIALGRAIDARTMWIDSIANGEEMSLSGRRARTLATRCLSQWPEVAAAEQVGYAGSVL